MANPQISEAFSDIIFVLLNLQAPPELSRTKARFLKLKAMKFCIIDQCSILERLWWHFIELFT